MSQETSDTGIFIRVDDEVIDTIGKIRVENKMKSNAQVVRTCVNIICALYNSKKVHKPDFSEEIISSFSELENGDTVFEYEKKYKRSKVTPSLEEYERE